MERKINSTMDLVNAIYQMKDKRNMTFEEIEKRVQISPGLISRWKKEKTGPRLEVIIEILETLDMDLYVRESDFTHTETERSRDEPLLDNSPISKLQMELMLAINSYFQKDDEEARKEFTEIIRILTQEHLEYNDLLGVFLLILVQIKKPT